MIVVVVTLMIGLCLGAAIGSTATAVYMAKHSSRKTLKQAAKRAAKIEKLALEDCLPAEHLDCGCGHLVAKHWRTEYKGMGCSFWQTCGCTLTRDEAGISAKAEIRNKLQLLRFGPTIELD